MYVRTYVRTYICTYVRTYVCMSVCMYTYIYIYTVYILIPTYTTYHPRNSDPMTPGRHDRQRAPLLLPLAQRDETDNYLLVLSRERMGMEGMGEWD